MGVGGGGTRNVQRAPIYRDYNSTYDWAWGLYLEGEFNGSIQDATYIGFIIQLLSTMDILVYNWVGFSSLKKNLNNQGAGRFFSVAHGSERLRDSSSCP